MKRFNAFSFNIPSGVPFNLREKQSEGLSISPSGGIKMVDENLSIRQSVLMILSMVPGERVMRPDYGCELYRLVFSPNDDTTAGLAIHYVKKAITKWERRIEIISIDAGQHPEIPEVLEISMNYRIINTQIEDHLIYSFNISGKE
jgi:hypothetical protein